MANDLIISSTSGTFSDETTGNPAPAGKLAAYVEGGTLTTGSAVHLDPASTIIHSLITTTSGTAVAGTAAKTYFKNAFGYTPDSSIAPVVPSTPLTVSNSEQRRAGLFAAAVSQIAFDLGVDQFDLISAIADDLLDAKLDGKNGSTGLSNMPSNPLTTFGKAMDKASQISYSNNYKIEYVPGAKTVKGKTTFQIKVSGRNDGVAATGLASSLALNPVMHMSADKSHAAPVDSCTEDAVLGTYNCAIYYLMATSMNGTTSSGYWEMEVKIGNPDSAYFYPFVSMPMDSTETVNKTMWGPSDIISGMTGTDTRKYYLFRDGAISAPTPTTTLNLFIAHDEGMMEVFKAVSVGTVLSSPTGAVDPMTVYASTDADPDPNIKTWLPAMDNGSGHWSVPDVPGLASGVTGTVYVKLSINGETKTTDGLASNPTGTNTYAAFTVKPL